MTSEKTHGAGAKEERLPALPVTAETWFEARVDIFAVRCQLTDRLISFLGRCGPPGRHH